MAQQPNAGQGHLILEVYKSHTTTDRSPLDEGSDHRSDLYLTTHNTQNSQIHTPGGIRIRNSSTRQDADTRLRPSATKVGKVLDYVRENKFSYVYFSSFRNSEGVSPFKTSDYTRLYSNKKVNVKKYWACGLRVTTKQIFKPC